MASPLLSPFDTVPSAELAPGRPDESGPFPSPGRRSHRRGVPVFGFLGLALTAAVLTDTLAQETASPTATPSEAARTAQAPAQPQSAPAPRKETEGSKKLWGALVYAAESAEGKRPGFEDADAEMSAMLRRVFPAYKHFQVLGVRAEALFKTTHSWVAPSKELCIKFDSKGPTEDGEGVRVDLQLWNRGKAILKTDAILRPGSPVFIEGPLWGAGHLVYVLKLQEGLAPGDDEQENVPNE